MSFSGYGKQSYMNSFVAISARTCQGCPTGGVVTRHLHGWEKGGADNPLAQSPASNGIIQAKDPSQ